MALIKEEFIAMQCDNCKELFENQYGESFFVDENAATDEATNWGTFIMHQGKHYCKDCCHTDDNDEIVINKQRISNDN